MDHLTEELPLEEQTSPSPAEEKKERRHLLIIVSVVVLIFALALGSFKLMGNSPTGALTVTVDEQHQRNYAGELPPEEGYMYNGFSFVKVDGLWWTERKVNNVLVKIPMHFSPKELENIPLQGQLEPSFNNGTLYFAIDPKTTNKYYTLAISELSFNVVKGVNRDPVSACSQEDPICGNLTILNCAQPQGKAVVELALGPKDKIEFNGSCIKVTGNELGLVRAVDRLLYRWYGIMP